MSYARHARDTTSCPGPGVGHICKHTLMHPTYQEARRPRGPGGQDARVYPFWTPKIKHSQSARGVELGSQHLRAVAWARGGLGVVGPFLTLKSSISRALEGPNWGPARWLGRCWCLRAVACPTLSCDLTPRKDAEKPAKPDIKSKSRV